MKKSIGLFVVALLISSATFASKSKAGTSSFAIDTKESKVFWTGKKVTGEHKGYLSIGSGNISVNDDKVVGGSIKMDLNSIVCTDLTDEQWNKKLVGHLKSEDFFSVEKFPNAIFEIGSILPDTNGDYTVEGNLTIKGKTHPISFPASVNLSDGKLNAKGTATIDRTKWDIKYGSGKFFQGLGDNLILDEFEITFEISAKSDLSLSLK